MPSSKCKRALPRAEGPGGRSPGAVAQVAQPVGNVMRLALLSSTLLAALVATAVSQVDLMDEVEETSLARVVAAMSPEGRDTPMARAVVDSFASPGGFPMGIDMEHGSGFCYHVDEARGEVYSVSSDGQTSYLWSVAAQIGHPLAGNVGNGVCLVEKPQGNRLYVTDFNGHTEDPGTDRVYEFGLDGTLVDSWDVESAADRVVGICFDGTSFWLSSEGRGEVVRCDTLFQELESFAHPDGSAGALDYDPETQLLYLTDYLSGDIHVCDGGMNVQDTFRGHESAVHVAGLSIGTTTRGRTLWMTTYGSLDPPASPCLFVVDDTYYNETPVEAATWTSLKVMYR